MNLSTRTVAAAFTLLTVGLLAQIANAQKCGHCGCDCDCCTVCVLECYEKEIEVDCWRCECEEFCLPGPCKLGCKNCCDACCDGLIGGKGLSGKGASCQKGGCGGPLGFCAKMFGWRDESPGCPTAHVKKKLMRKKVKHKIPAYRWVVTSCCKSCVDQIEGAEIPPDAEIPAPPELDGTAIYKYRIRGGGQRLANFIGQ